MSQLDRDAYGAESASCFGKERFEPSQFARAHRTAKAMSRRVHEPLMAYRCPWCDGWHIGRRIKDPKALALRKQQAWVAGPSQPPEPCHGRQHHP